MTAVNAIQKASLKKDVKKSLSENVWGSPTDSAIYYGDTDISMLIRQDIDGGYKVYETLGGSDCNFIEPLPLGSEMKIIESIEEKSNKKTYTYYGIQGVDFKVTKPGIVYFHAKENPTKKELKAELKQVTKLLVYFKESDWEPVIFARIEELKNEIK